jgi:AI-2 transport protein TqsA
MHGFARNRCRLLALCTERRRADADARQSTVPGFDATPCGAAKHKFGNGSRWIMKVSIGITAAILVLAAAALASTVLAPLALALFIIALVWPLQSRLSVSMPKLPALAITILITIAVGVAFASLAVWAFGRVGRSLITEAALYQAFYDRAVGWLDRHGISVAGLWAEHFNVGWLVRATQQATGRVNTTLTFWIIALVYTTLGLLEVDQARQKIEMLQNREMARVLLDASATTAAKFRKYILVRTQMSLLTGLFVGVFAWVAGLRLATEWGVVAFVMNYIPFIGPFIATLFPTLLALTQFDSWIGVVGVFICLNMIQFAIGSFIEPRVAGSVLSISPFVVLFSVLLWTFLWGIFGAFIGVPISLALLSFCSELPSTRWIADLLGGPKPSASQSA